MALERAQPTSESDLLRILADEVGRRIPPGWESDLRLIPQGRGPDAILSLRGPDGSEGSFSVAAKTTINTRDVPALLDSMRRMLDKTTDEPNLLVIARYLAPRTRDRLREASASFADATGNLRLASARPAVFIEGAGASSDPWRGPERQTKTLKGRPAAKIVRALVDFRPPYGVRELSKISGASLGSTYRVVDFLDREALIRRDDKGAVVDVDWPALLSRWAEDYEFQRSNQVTSAFEPRGTPRLLDALSSGVAGRYAVTGSAAAARVAPVAETRLTLLFAEDPAGLLEELDLRSSGPPNVLVARPFDDVVFDRTIEDGGLVYTAFSQAAADLLTSPGRGPAEAEALISWMKGNEDVWRR
ncbi:MAG TPA: hypothetical protein VFL73_00400 [Solirubrobacteraceae bacterium]|nr:hypothetical protein [Solirubrobacteraceae bacterium]